MAKINKPTVFSNERYKNSMPESIIKKTRTKTTQTQSQKDSQHARELQNTITKSSNSSNTNYVNSASTLGEVAGKIIPRIDNNDVYSTAIQFIAGLDNMKTFRIESSGSFSKHTFLSLSHEKNGSGKANNFTLTVVYAPSSDSNISNETSTDKTVAEKTILSVMTEIDEVLLERSILPCKFRYGYSFENDLIMSPWYSGSITEYNVEIRDGLIYYTISGISSISAMYKDESVKISDTGIDLKNRKPTEVFKEVFEYYCNSGVSNYELIYEPNSLLGSDKEVDLSELPDTGTIFGYLQEIINRAEDPNERNDDESDPEDLSKTNRYYFEVNDISDKMQVIVKTKQLSEENQNKSCYTFYWMSNKQNVILNFSNSYSGVVMSSLLSKAIQQKEEILTIDEDGNEKTISKSKLSNNMHRYRKNVITGWLDNLEYSYEANLTVVGIPAKIFLMDVITVNIIINGSKFHLSGDYAIQGIEDLIDSNGYQTSFRLFKINSGITKALQNTKNFLNAWNGKGREDLENILKSKGKNEKDLLKIVGDIDYSEWETEDDDKSNSIENANRRNDPTSNSKNSNNFGK